MSQVKEGKKEKISTEKKEPFRVLVLHGYRQSGSILKEKTKTFRRGLKKEMEFQFMTAPFRLNPTDPEEEKEGIEYYQWWTTTLEGLFNNPSYDTIEESCEAVSEALIKGFDNKGERKDFDGILGFSQGATLLSLMLFHGMLENKNLKFAIIIGAFTVTDETYKFDNENTLAKTEIPTLHVYGEGDDLVHYNHSQKNANKFNPELTSEFLHKGGHHIPSNSEAKMNYRKFLDTL